MGMMGAAVETGVKEPSKKKKRRRLQVRIVPAGSVNPRTWVMVAADDYTRHTMYRRRFRLGDILSALFKKPRNYPAHKHAHKLGQMLAANLDDFTGMDAHAVLKRLQLLGNIECEATLVRLPDGTLVEARQARSLAYEEMEQTEFDAVIGAMAQYVSDHYWPETEPWQVLQMAGEWQEV